MFLRQLNFEKIADRVPGEKACISLWLREYRGMKQAGPDICEKGRLACVVWNMKAQEQKGLMRMKKAVLSVQIGTWQQKNRQGLSL